MKRPSLFWAAAPILLLVLACGGGGGGGPAPDTVSLFGRVVWIVNGAPPNPAATVRSGDASTTSNLIDGGFSLDVPSGADEATVSATVSGVPAVATFTFAPATSSRDLGDLYLGPQTVTVSGRALSTGGGGVAGAVVRLAGRTAVSDATGRFSLMNVAYSSDFPTVFLGLQGSASAMGFFDGFFSPPSTAVSGVVEVGDVLLTPVGSTTPPPPPYSLNGTVGPSGGGAQLEARIGTTVIRRATADATGGFRMWLAAGTYTIHAVSGSRSGSAPVTVTDPSLIVDVSVPLS
ncbi:MAG: hypothetical protein MH204_08190 [Fimbriimonadaceae bacterium]|nr:hypothetical protein [Fimbriimonadaceae bacterium]